jgi:hypothetical protein
VLEPPDTADLGPAKNNSEAQRRFFASLNQVIQVVCPNAHFRASPRVTVRGGWSATTVPTSVLPLKRTNGPRLHLRSTIEFDYVDHPERPGERKVTTRSYFHTVTRDEQLEVELFSWHWGHKRWPHVHVDKGSPGGLGGLHIPTGRVWLEQIVAFLVDDLDVIPHGSDWEDVLSRNLARLTRHATWGRLSSSR